MFKLNLTGWTPEQFKKFVNHLAYNRVKNATDMLHLVIEAWDLEADPKDPASYETLGFLDLAPVLKQVEAEAVRQFQEAEIPDGLVIDLRPWTMMDYQKYMERVTRSDFTGAIEFVAKVVKAWPWKEPVSEDAIRKMDVLRFGSIAKAVGKAVNDSFRAG